MKRIVCFGDSNTWGFNPANAERFDENTRWPMVLQKLLGGEYQMIEEGQCGRSISNDDIWEGGTKCGMDYLLPMLESHMPLDLLIIMLGTNDLKNRFGLAAEEIAGSMDTMVYRAKSFLSMKLESTAKILLVSPIWIGADIEQITNTVYMFERTSLVESKRLGRLYGAIAAKYDCAFFDAATAANPSTTDCLHLDKAGHKALAQAMAEQVCRLI